MYMNRIVLITKEEFSFNGENSYIAESDRGVMFYDQFGHVQRFFPWSSVLKVEKEFRSVNED